MLYTKLFAFLSVYPVKELNFYQYEKFEVFHPEVL